MREFRIMDYPSAHLGQGPTYWDQLATVPEGPGLVGELARYAFPHLYEVQARLPDAVPSLNRPPPTLPAPESAHAPVQAQPLPQLLPVDTLWTVDDVAAFMRVSVSKVHKDSAAGRLPAIRHLGRKLLFDPQRIHALTTKKGSQP